MVNKFEIVIKELIILSFKPSQSIKWQEQNKPQERTLVERHQESTLLTNKLKRQLQPQVESRSHTDSDQEQSLSEKSEDSKRALNSSLENFLSKD